MSTRFEALLPRLRELAYLRSASGLLEWDQQVNMPSKGAAARGELLAYLSVLHHDKTTDPVLLSDLRALSGEQDDLTDEERAAVRELLRDLERAAKLPAEFVQELAELSSNAFHAWEKAREASDFSASDGS